MDQQFFERRWSAAEVTVKEVSDKPSQMPAENDCLAPLQPKVRGVNRCPQLDSCRSIEAVRGMPLGTPLECFITASWALG